jgi:coenzyme F420-0:L-glutamate ligase/coenzyme F420-1:gamma-L-glutamate ligase
VRGTSILIPVKLHARAKGRLAPLLDLPTRQQLARVMLEDVLTAIMPAVGRLVDGVYVATADREAMRAAERHGAMILEEDEQRSESQSVDWASRLCAEQGVPALLTIPADAPAIRADDVAAVLGATPGRQVVLVPSADETGTNGIWRRPPDAMPSRFGFDSLRKHRAEAESRGLPCAIVRVPRLAVDIDSPEDLHAFLALPGETRTRRFLEEHEVAAQVRDGYRPALSLLGIPGLPEIGEGQDLAAAILEAAERLDEPLQSGDVLVIAQKIVSKAEGRVIPLAGIQPSAMAEEFAGAWNRDPRLVEVVLREARRVIRMDRGTLIVETRQGLVCANAGVDASNVPGEDHVSLLPVDPDASAAQLRKALADRRGVDLAIVISDTFGRPWREGLLNVAIGVAGLHPLLSYVGQQDPHGHTLRVTELAVADELAAAAGLVMGKLERIPVVRIRGYRYQAAEGHSRALIRPPERDLFR